QVREIEQYRYPYLLLGDLRHLFRGLHHGRHMWCPRRQPLGFPKRPERQGHALVLWALPCFCNLFCHDRALRRYNKSGRRSDNSEDRNMADELVTVATFSTLTEAEAAKVALEAEGIRTLLNDMDWQELGYSVPNLKLQVNQKDAAQAA